MANKTDHTAKPVVAETAKPAVTAEPKIKSTPVNERQYRLVAEPSIAPKGKQRQIVIAALKSSDKPMTVEQVAAFATKAGLVATGGITPSVRYHLHHLTLLKVAEVINPQTASKSAEKVA